MELVRVKLQTLLELLTFKEQTQPNNHHQNRPVSSSYASLKKILNETIQFLAYLTLRSRQEVLEKDGLILQMYCSQEEIAKLHLVKQQLQDIRKQLALPSVEQRMTITQMRAEIKAMLNKCSNYPAFYPEKQPTQKRFSNTWGEGGVRVETEAQRTVRVKEELRKEMNQRLKSRRGSDREVPIFTPAETYPVRDHLYLQRRDQIIIKEEPQVVRPKVGGSERKKRYNYLQQCEKEIQKIRLQADLKENHVFFTPSTKKTMPHLQSTQQSYDDPLGEELQRTLTNDFDAPIASDFDQFEDSIERGKGKDIPEEADNLDDSLELMKQEEGLNRTAFFGSVTVSGEQNAEGLNYSFSYDNK